MANAHFEYNPDNSYGVWYLSYEQDRNALSAHPNSVVAVKTPYQYILRRFDGVKAETYFTEYGLNKPLTTNIPISYIEVKFTIQNETVTDTRASIYHITKQRGNPTRSINMIENLPNVNPAYAPGSADAEILEIYMNEPITYSDIQAILEEYDTPEYELPNTLKYFEQATSPAIPEALHLLRIFMKHYDATQADVRGRLQVAGKKKKRKTKKTKKKKKTNQKNKANKKAKKIKRRTQKR